MCALPHSVPATLQQAITDPRLHRRPLDTPGQVWVSLLWGHCSFLLGPGVHRFCVPSKSLSPHSCANSGGSMVGLMESSSRMAYSTPRSGTQSPCPCSRPLLTRTSTGDIQTLKSRSGSVSVGSSGEDKLLFEPSERLWQVWSLILNMILPLLPSCWGFSFAL